MKRLTAIILSLVFIAIMFAGCQASENTDTDIPVGNTDVQLEDGDTPSDIVEEEATTEKPTETTTAETTTEKVTEATTKAEASTKKETTTKKAETTTKAKQSETTTKKQETTTRSETTTKKPETTTKPSTTKPATTTSHAHDWKAHYTERKVLVKEAYDEEGYWVDQYHTHISGLECVTCGKKFGFTCNTCGYFYAYEEDGTTPYGNDTNGSPTGNSADYDAGKHKAETGHSFKRLGPSIADIDLSYYVEGKHHDAEYKTEKYIDYYYCSCGAKKDA